MNARDLFDAEAEEALVESLLLRPQQLANVRALVDVVDFSDTFLGTLYSTMLELDSEGVEPNYITVRARLRSQPGYMGAAWNGRLLGLHTPTPNYRMAMHYAEIVHDLAGRRRIAIVLEDGLREGLTTEQLVERTLVAAGMVIDWDREDVTA